MGNSRNMPILCRVSSSHTRSIVQTRDCWKNCWCWRASVVEPPCLVQRLTGSCRMATSYHRVVIHPPPLPLGVNLWAWPKRRFSHRNVCRTNRSSKFHRCQRGISRHRRRQRKKPISERTQMFPRGWRECGKGSTTWEMRARLPWSTPCGMYSVSPFLRVRDLWRQKHDN